MTFWQSPTWAGGTTSLYAPACDRPLPPWRESPELLRQSRDFDVVVTMGGRESLFYGLLCALTGRPSKQIMTEVFIDQPRPASPLWQLKVALYRLVARRALGILTNSSGEVASIAQRYRIPTGRLRYVPMHSNIVEPKRSEANDGFVFSAGYTLRDYPCLLRAAPSIPAPVVIMCSRHELRDEPIPATVTVIRDAPRKIYLDYLRRCSLVALPLLATERSTGQVVLLEAMAFGKPVVASRVAGIADHVRHGENGLIVEPGDPVALASEVNRLLSHPEEARRLAERGLEDVARLFTPEIHARSKLDAIRELYQSASTR